MLRGSPSIQWDITQNVVIEENFLHSIMQNRKSSGKGNLDLALAAGGSRKSCRLGSIPFP